MSSLKLWASEASEALAVTGLHPTLPRSSLTRARIAAWVEAAVVVGVLLFDGAGAEDFAAALVSGAFEAEEEEEEGLAGSFFRTDAFLLAVVFDGEAVLAGDAVFDGDADLDGEAVFEGPAEAEAEDECEALGEAEPEGVDVAECDFLGAAGRSVPRLAGVEAEDRSEGDAVTPPG